HRQLFDLQLTNSFSIHSSPTAFRFTVHRQLFDSRLTDSFSIHSSPTAMRFTAHQQLVDSTGDRPMAYQLQ
ncbi:hypothetical protein SK128_023301, partial [Halocaridina rubra]